MTISGIVLYIAPVGKIARWTSWVVMGLSKQQWEELHTIFSFLFAIFSLMHIFNFNRRAIVSYIKSKTGKSINRGHEAIAATFISATILAFTIFVIPPIKGVLSFGSKASNYWQEKAPPLPFSNAQDSKLEMFSSKQFEVSTDSLAQILINNNLQVDSNKTIKEIGEDNNMSADDVYAILLNHFIKN